jgi:hypothetical protein
MLLHFLNKYNFWFIFIHQKSNTLFKPLRCAIITLDRCLNVRLSVCLFYQQFPFATCCTGLASGIIRQQNKEDKMTSTDIFRHTQTQWDDLNVLIWSKNRGETIKTTKTRKWRVGQLVSTCLSNWLSFLPTAKESETVLR